MRPSSLAERLASEVAGEVRADEPLAPKTSVKVGGRAEAYVRPSEVEALVALLRRAREHRIPLAVLGGGANTLVGDGGVPGVTLRLPAELFAEQVEARPGGLAVTLSAGAPIARLIQLMKTHRLVGAEFLAGIPGTIGGACAMNAGTKAGECMSVVEALELATADGVGWVPREELAARYRATALPEAAVVTRARFLLPEGDTESSQRKMEEDLAHRRRTQPLTLPSFGSVFTNPPGSYAGKLIEGVGLKGHTIGRAQISSLHANFIVNLGGATAHDIVALMELAQARVKEETGVLLEPEVKRVGVFV
ncbi:MAG: UDP-N-acetylmuramate dehydrogenase [Myxococcales bacterium]|nr:UDP-N-acetylmuramate dehydrogenase [Myxococcales bacterium]